MFIIITLLLTVLVSGIFGAVPAVVSRRRVSRRDAAWAAGLWHQHCNLYYGAEKEQGREQDAVC